MVRRLLDRSGEHRTGQGAPERSWDSRGCMKDKKMLCGDVEDNGGGGGH